MSRDSKITSRPTSRSFLRCSCDLSVEYFHAHNSAVFKMGVITSLVFLLFSLCVKHFFIRASLSFYPKVVCFPSTTLPPPFQNGTPSEIPKFQFSLTFKEENNERRYVYSSKNLRNNMWFFVCSDQSILMVFECSIWFIAKILQATHFYD